MKISNIVFVFIFSFLLQNCNTIVDPGFASKWTKGKQITSSDDSLIPDSLKALFREDAAILALRDVQDNPESKGSLVILPEELIEFYYRGLVHIYNAFSIAARDSVMDIYKIHTFRYPEPHSLIVSVDSTKDWVKAWQNGEDFTGNQQIDYLMQTYDLQLYRYYDWPWSHAAVIISMEPINIFALGKKFAPIDGVVYAEPDGIVGDGNDIKGSIETNYLLIEFSVGWGDCPAGCIARRYWEFHVYFDGTVEFIRSYGTPP